MHFSPRGTTTAAQRSLGYLWNIFSLVGERGWFAYLRCVLDSLVAFYYRSVCVRCCFVTVLFHIMLDSAVFLIAYVITQRPTLIRAAFAFFLSLLSFLPDLLQLVIVHYFIHTSYFTDWRYPSCTVKQYALMNNNPCIRKTFLTLPTFFIIQQISP